MARLIAPNGSTISVSDERAKVLLAQGGYRGADDKKAPAKKSAAKSDK